MQKPTRLLSITLILFSVAFCSADEPPVTDLYMRAIVSGAKRALEWQSDNGRYNRSAEERNREIQDQLATSQMGIYPLAYLYVTEHPLNPYFGDDRVLQSVIRCGDYLSGYQPTSFWPLSHWTVHSWLCALELVGERFGEERKVLWGRSIEHWVKHYLEYLEKSRGKREYTAVELGTSPNHYSLYLVAVMKAGEVLGQPEWTRFARDQFRNLLRSRHPDGYWAEHHGPANRYTWLTLQGVGLYYEMTGDPEALEAIGRAKDFLLGFTYPDGSAVAVIDERNRYSPSPAARHGLLGLGHFPDGRRFCRLTAEKFVDGTGLSNETLSHLTDALRYWTQGPEEPVPWDSESYDRTLVSGARLMRRGDWIITFSGIVSPPWDGNRFFLDRYISLEVWHARAGLVIGGGLTKRQPQIATVLMEPSHGALDYWPRDSRITAWGDSMSLELTLDKFRAVLTTNILNDNEMTLRVRFIETSEPILWPNRYECNLQLQVKPGEKLVYGGGELNLGMERTTILERELGGRLETAGWVLETPPGRTGFRFPFHPFNNYDVDGIGAPSVGIISSAARIYEEDLEYRLRIR